MFRSIRTALLFWYGLIFLILLASYGATIYLRLRRSLFKAVDAKLEDYAHSLASGLVEMSDRSLDLEVPTTVRLLFKRGDDLPYYLIWDHTGRVIHRSDHAPDASRPSSTTPRSRGSSREVAVQGPLGTWILVGRQAKHEMENLTEFLFTSLGAGGAFIAVALGGGWFLISRGLRPIARISEAASRISAEDLSRRIDVAQTEDELGRLARTLNGMFERLQASFERQARFTADASHELRTPLALVLSQAELSLMKERSGSEYRDALLAVQRASERMKGIVEGLLTLARADAKQLALAREVVPMSAIVEETAQMLGPLAAQGRVSVSIRAEPVQVEGDRERLRDVVANLLSNAIRYSAPGGRVEVTVTGEGPCAVLKVADTGIGIPEKDRPHIFERFYRVDQARSRDRGGSGLGLAITKWVVEAHQGSISFESQEGRGTTFTVELPKGQVRAA